MVSREVALADLVNESTELATTILRNERLLTEGGWAISCTFPFILLF
jgi:hypothetical protein